MKIPKKDLKIDRVRGSGPGGQNVNRRATAVRITHLPTGITVRCHERTQQSSHRKALKELEIRLQEADREARAAEKKAERDRKVREQGTVRTYNEPRDEVRDHRTKQKARFRDVLKKGNLNALWDA